MVGQKTPNNLIFVFSSNGKRFKTIELETLIEGITTQTKWALMAFNSDEDLVLMTAEGRLFIIDTFLGTVKDKYSFFGFSDKASNIDEGKIQAWQHKAIGKEDQVECDTIVFRTKSQKFFYSTNVRAGELKDIQPNPLRTNTRLERFANEQI